MPTPALLPFDDRVQQGDLLPSLSLRAWKFFDVFAEHCIAGVRTRSDYELSEFGADSRKGLMGGKSQLLAFDTDLLEKAYK